MRKAYIVAAKRSAIGTFLGSLTDVDLATVGATVLKETIKQANIDPANLDEVIIGNVIAAGLGQNIARHVAFDAGIPVEVCTIYQYVMGFRFESRYGSYTSYSS